jgi:hypothetical protein
VLTRPGFVRAAPTLPGTTRIRLPSTPSTCCDRQTAKVSHLRSNQQHLTAQTEKLTPPPWAHQIELLQTIPGGGEKVAQVIIAETGGDMSRFPTAAHLAAWAGLAPGMNESAGKQSPAGKRHGNKWLTAMLVEAAGSVGRMHGKNYLAVQHARLMKRRGMGRAQVAVAHSILVSAHWMLKRDEPYHDLGADWHTRRNDQAHTRRLIAQLERLGHTVIINPAA